MTMLRARLAIRGQFNAVGAAINKPETEKVLQLANGLRDYRLRSHELLGRPCHAAGLSDGKKNPQLSKLEALRDQLGSHASPLSRKANTPR
jgi:hypothetical protein